MNVDLKGSSSSYTKGMVVGALIGGAVSGLAALLFAPKRGVELRRDIANKTSETYSTVANRASTIAQDAASRVTSFVEQMQTRNEGGRNGNSRVGTLEKSSQSSGQSAANISGSSASGSSASGKS